MSVACDITLAAELRPKAASRPIGCLLHNAARMGRRIEAARLASDCHAGHDRRGLSRQYRRDRPVSARKILHMHFGKEGGAERFFVNLAQAFAERGMEQRFVIRPGRLWRDDVAAFGLVIENHYRRVSPSSMLLSWRVRRLIDIWQPDVIMSWMPRSSRLMPGDPRVAGK